MTAERHVCFGCGNHIGDGEPHIHVPLDEWSATKGLQQFGMDDLFTFPFCEPCTEESERGWKIHAHRVDGGSTT